MGYEETVTIGLGGYALFTYYTHILHYGRTISLFFGDLFVPLLKLKVSRHADGH